MNREEIKRKHKLQDLFNDKCYYWMKELGFEPIFDANDEIHFTKDGRIRLICINKGEQYGKFHIDVSTPSPHSIVGIKFKLFNDELMLSELDNFKSILSK